MTDRLPWFRCFPDRLLGALAEMDGDTQHVYVTVLLKIYARGGPIRHDPKVLAVFCRRATKSVVAALDRLAEMGRITVLDGMISNDVAEAELEHRIEVSNSRAKNGKSGGKKSAASRAEKPQQNQSQDEAIASISEATRSKNEHTKTKIKIKTKKEDLVAKATAETSSAEAPDPSIAERIWKHYPGILTLMSNRSEAHVRTWIGKLLAEHSAEGVLAALEAAVKAGTGDPIAYANRVLTPKNRGSPDAGSDRSVHDVARALEQWAKDDVQPPDEMRAIGRC